MAITASAKAPLLTVTVLVSAAAVIDGTIGPVLVPSEHNHWPERFRRYDGTAAEVRTMMIADGFDPYGEEVKHAFSLLSPPAAPVFLLWGRRTGADATWEQAVQAIMQAIADAPPEAELRTPAYLCPVTRAESEQIELFKAATDNQRDMLPVIQTASVGVRDNQLGSLEKALKAVNKQGVLVYYDAATATEADSASATTSEGPWAVTLDLTATPPQATASLAFDDDSGVIATLQADHGTFLSANAEPYNLEPGWSLDYERDNDGVTVNVEVAATAAVITGTAIDTGGGGADFVLADGLPVVVVVRGNVVAFTVNTANYVDVSAATAAEVCAELDTALFAVADSAAPYNRVVVTDKVRGNTSDIYFAPGTSAIYAAAIGVTVGTHAQGSGNVGNVDGVLAAELAAIALLQTGEDESCQAEGSPAKVRISGLVYGTGGAVKILASSNASMLTALGLGPAPATDNGSGDCADADAVTPAELFAVLDTDWPDADVSNDNPDPTVTVGGGEVGSPHVMIIDGALAEAVGLLGSFLAPGEADQHADAAWLGSRAGIDHGAVAPFGGCLSWNNVALPGVTGERASFSSTGDRLNRTQDVNYVIRWTAARGGEAHDGRLLIRHVGGASAYADQWEAAHWIAQLTAATIKAALDNGPDTGTQTPYQDPAILGFFMGLFKSIAGQLFQTQIIAAVDLDPPGPTKLTGLKIIPKAQLSSEERDLRLGKVIWTVELSGALHGGIIQIGLLV